MRVGQKNKITYRWARTGSRPRADHDQRTQSAYLFGAVMPRTRNWRSPRAAGLQHPSHAASPRRNRNRSRPRCSRHSHPRSSRMARRKRPQGSQAISRSCRCRRARPNSILKKTSGSSCVKIGCRTASLNPSTTFSITAATLGGRSSINPGKSCLSLAAIGQPSVSQSE